MAIQLNNQEDFQEKEFKKYSIEDDSLEEDEELQRTEDWLNLRNGKWSASMIKKLMSCNLRGGRMDWFNPRKTLEFSESSLKSIYANAKARQRGYYIETITGKAMSYGTKIEPLVAEITNNYLKTLNLNFQKTGFVTFENIPTAGVSSDFLAYDFYGKLIFNGEQKACVSWDSHFERTFESVDEKGIDFWQTQMQMACHKTNKTLYVISEPPKNINKYIYSEDVWELFEDFKKECAVSFHIIESSPIHIKALLKRIEISEKVISAWLEDNSLNIRNLLNDVLDSEKKLLSQENYIVEKPKESKKELKESEEIKKSDTEPTEEKVIKEEIIEEKPTDKTIIKEIPIDIPF